MATYIYNSDEVDIFVANLPIKRGRADGEFLKIENEGDDFTHKVGTDGDVVISKTNNNVATITIVLMQSSPENDVLSNLRKSMKRGQTGAGVGPFLAKDRSGRAIHQGNACWIVKPPTRGFGKEAGTREWTLRVANLDSTDGGNTQIGV